MLHIVAGTPVVTECTFLKLCKLLKCNKNCKAINLDALPLAHFSPLLYLYKNQLFDLKC